MERQQSDNLGCAPTLAAVFALLLGFLLCGCVTEHRATRWMDDHGFRAASYCKTSFPCILDVRPGDTVLIPGDTILIPGDSVECPPQKIGDHPAIAPCPPSRMIRDTILIRDTLTIMDSADIHALRGQLEAQDRELDKAQKMANRLKNGRNTWRSIAIPLIAALLAWVAVKFKII